jgi:hypothetical protein
MQQYKKLQLVLLVLLYFDFSSGIPAAAAAAPLRGDSNELKPMVSTAGH